MITKESQFGRNHQKVSKVVAIVRRSSNSIIASTQVRSQELHGLTRIGLRESTDVADDREGLDLDIGEFRRCKWELWISLERYAHLLLCGSSLAASARGQFASQP